MPNYVPANYVPANYVPANYVPGSPLLTPLADDLNAMGIVAMLILIVLCRIRRYSAPTSKRVLCAFLSAVGGLLGMAPTHMCDAGNPVSQPGVAAFGAAYLILFARDLRVVVPTCLVLWCTGVLLSLSYVEIVHTDTFTGRGGEPRAIWLWHSWFSGLFGFGR